MYTALDDITFLAGSENRTGVLDAVHGGAKSRNELRELTGASRITVRRVLGDLQARTRWRVRSR